MPRTPRSHKRSNRGFGFCKGGWGPFDFSDRTKRFVKGGEKLNDKKRGRHKSYSIE